MCQLFACTTTYQGIVKLLRVVVDAQSQRDRFKVREILSGRQWRTFGAYAW